MSLLITLSLSRCHRRRRPRSAAVRSSVHFVAAGNGEDTGAQNVGQQMGDPVRIAAIRDRPSEPFGDAEPMIGLGEQHDPAIGTDPSAVKGGGDLLAADGWKTERQKVIVDHGGCGALRSRRRGGFSNRILRPIKSLRYFRHPKSGPVMNTMGSYV